MWEPHWEILAQGRTKTKKGQYFSVRIEQTRLARSLLYGAPTKLVYLEFSGFSELKDTAHDRFHGNGPDGQIPTKKEPIRTLGFTSRLPRHIINTSYLQMVIAAGPYL